VLKCSKDGCDKPAGYFQRVGGRWCFVWQSKHDEKDWNAIELRATLEILEKQEGG
jgi:hypothetical protein